MSNWEEKYDLDKVYEIRCKTTLYFGCGAIKKIDDIMKVLEAKKISKILVVTSKTAYIKCGAWAEVKPALEKYKMKYEVFNNFKPNPSHIDVDEAVKVGKKLGAQCVLAIGGGSPIDAGKAAACLLHKDNHKYGCEELMKWKFTAENAVPIVTINTTHGTGTETDRFAVVSIIKEKLKPLIAPECIYPLFSIDDPNLMFKLNLEQTCFTAVDALTHSIESATTKIQSPYTIHLAKVAIRLIAKYLPIAVKDLNDKKARYWLLYASALAGIAFDNSLLHLVHALEHPISGIKPNFYHGYGLGLLLPSIIDTIYHTNSDIIAECLKPIIPDATGENNDKEKKKVVVGLQNWLQKYKVEGYLTGHGIGKKEVDELTELAFNTPSLGVCLGMSPVEATKEVVRDIYTKALKKMYS